MNFVKKPTPIPGCFELQPAVRKDARGAFVKVFHSPEFRKLGLETDFREEYYSVSKKGVLRGLHFQEPPADHEKVVCCPVGEVLDAVLDLRASSGYGRSFTLELSAEKGNMLYIPRGCAHGFFALSRSVMLYRTGTVHSPEHDAGVLWSSAGIKWPSRKPLISDRDAAFAPLAGFRTPFKGRGRRK